MVRAFTVVVVIGWLTAAVQVYLGETRFIGSLACLFVAWEFAFNGERRTRQLLNMQSHRDAENE